jgi:hypothetical protein
VPLHLGHHQALFHQPHRLREPRCRKDIAGVLQGKGVLHWV